MSQSLHYQLFCSKIFDDGHRKVRLEQRLRSFDPYVGEARRVMEPEEAPASAPRIVKAITTAPDIGVKASSDRIVRSDTAVRFMRDMKKIIS